MASREAMLRSIDLLYARRVAGDKAGVAELLAPGATFRIAGDSLPIPGVPPGEGPADRKIADLIDAFTFHKIERLDALVDGDRMALRSRAHISRDAGEVMIAELYDLWTFSADGKIASGLQFGDAALIARLIAAD